MTINNACHDRSWYQSSCNRLAWTHRAWFMPELNVSLTNQSKLLIPPTIILICCHGEYTDLDLDKESWEHTNTDMSL